MNHEFVAVMKYNDDDFTCQWTGEIRIITEIKLMEE